MNDIHQLETPRLSLRQWRVADYAAFAEINADPEVMEFFPHVLTNTESDILADKLKMLITEQGWGFWALEIKQTQEFIGFVGLHRPSYDLPVSPCVEIGWRLSKTFWGQGYATEAARAALRFAFEELQLNDVYSFTSQVNEKSQDVMKRLNMVNTGKNFNHPIISISHPLCEHVLYKITAQAWHMNNK